MLESNNVDTNSTRPSEDLNIRISSSLDILKIKIFHDIFQIYLSNIN